VSSVQVETQHERARLGAAYRRVLVPLLDPVDGDVSVAEACLLVSDGGTVIVLAPVEFALERGPDAPKPPLGPDLRDAFSRARAIGRAHGVDVATRVAHTRSAGETIVNEAGSSAVDAVLVRVRRSAPLGHTVEYVLRNAPCRVLVSAE
jgi:nucleotide-binding universal stress UspA family protein